MCSSKISMAILTNAGWATHLYAQCIRIEFHFTRWVRYSRSIMTGGNLSQLVGLDLVHGGRVCSFIVLDGDLGRHATHGSDLSPARSWVRKGGPSESEVTYL